MYLNVPLSGFFILKTLNYDDEFWKNSCNIFFHSVAHIRAIASLRNINDNLALKQISNNSRYLTVHIYGIKYDKSR